MHPCAQNVPIQVKNIVPDNTDSFHLKTIVIDKKIVILGSTNWTASAFDNNIETDVLINSDKTNLFTCAGIIEKDNYQRVIVVFVKAAGASHRHAAGVAVPLFERVTEKVLHHTSVPMFIIPMREHH